MGPSDVVRGKRRKNFRTISLAQNPSFVEVVYSLPRCGGFVCLIKFHLVLGVPWRCSFACGDFGCRSFPNLANMGIRVGSRI